MNLLALDTTMRACSAAVLRAGEDGPELFHAYAARERGHAEAIMPMVEQVMGAADLSYDALERIAVTVGPGTFTGVRVGVAAARGLALATAAPVTGVTSLEVIARRACDLGGGEEGFVGVAADARRGQVYFALYDAQGTALQVPVVLAPEDAAGLIPVSAAVTLAGSGARLVAEAAPERGFECLAGDLQPDAATLAHLAAGREASSGPVSPLYLRAPDAKPQSGAAVAHV
jgi:tRNA threonylcarbamoyladenosine biosynthesis protein TsaB